MENNRSHHRCTIFHYPCEGHNENTLAFVPVVAFIAVFVDEVPAVSRLLTVPSAWGCSLVCPVLVVIFSNHKHGRFYFNATHDLCSDISPTQLCRLLCKSKQLCLVTITEAVHVRMSVSSCTLPPPEALSSRTAASSAFTSWHPENHAHAPAWDLTFYF